MPYKNPADAKARHSRYFQTHKTEAFARSEKYKDLKEAVKYYKEINPCHDCGRNYPAPVMEFDHVRGVKSFCLGHPDRRGLKKILDEIEKCDLVCANCHRIRHIARKSSSV